MALIVQKFGGTSVATLDRIKNVAGIIAKTIVEKHKLVAVVSAMAGVTNKFIGYAYNLGVFEGEPEYDHVVSSGELVTSGLLAIALKKVGINAKSYASWQVPIFTDSNYGRAIIQKIDPSNLQRDIANGIVPIVCGFQGISPDNRVTTLGRGGSDLTAVAVASAINADLCEIYSDVDGVYTVDPNLYTEAKRIDQISYQEMLEMAAQGAKVLQEQSVNYAMKKNVKIRVASSFIDNGGTIISEGALKKPFRGLAVTHNISQIKISYKDASNLSKLIEFLENNFIHTEILKNNSSNKSILLVDRNKTPASMSLLGNCDFITCANREISRKRLSRISVIGSFMSEKNKDLLEEILQSKKIEIFCSSRRYSRISFIIPSDQLLSSVNVLHKHCELDK